MWIILGSIGGLLVVFLLIFIVQTVVMKTIVPKLEARITETYKEDQILLKDAGAMSLGLTSRGVTQGRGNGALVLTANTLHWFQFVPKSSDVLISRADITEVTTTRSHLGKAIGRDLLLVKFTYNGQPDSMAWHVTDLQAWLSKLQQPAKTGMLR
jgi:hypothetical protein